MEAIYAKMYSYDAGKELCTFVTKANSMEQPGWKYVVQMGVFIDKNDDGTFAVWKADTSKPKGVPKDLLPLVDKWAQMVNKNMDKIKTDEEVI